MNDLNKLDEQWGLVKTKYEVGQMVKGRVILHQHFGVFIDLGEERIYGLVMIINISDEPFTGTSGFPPIHQEIEGIIIGFQDYKIHISLRESDF